MKNILGIIFPDNNKLTPWYDSFYELPVAGGYKLIDFPLSSMSNSGIRKIGIAAKEITPGLYDHLQGGAAWNLEKSSQGLYLLQGGDKMKNDITHVLYNFIKTCKEKYVLLSGCTFAYNMLFCGLLDFHLNKKSDLTVACTKSDVCGMGLHIDEENNVNSVSDGGARADRFNSINIYLINRYLLLKLLENHIFKNKNIYEYIVNNLREMRVFAYLHEGYIFDPCTPLSYFKASKEILSFKNRTSLLGSENLIYTNKKYHPPIKCFEQANVKNCISGDGCTVEGSATDSILFRGIRIMHNAEIKDCVIMDKCFIGKNCSIENAILQEECIVKEGISVCGDPENPLVLEKGTIISESIRKI